MQIKEPLIEPMIYHGPGGCPKCSGPITVADSELTIMDLNQDGDPISSETTIRCMGCCMHCGNKIPMMRFKGSYIPYSESSKIIRTMEFKDEMAQRIAEVNKNSNGKNPFAIES